MVALALGLLLPAEVGAAYVDDQSFLGGTVVSLLIAFVGYPWVVGALIADLQGRGPLPFEPYGRTVRRLPALAVASTVTGIATVLGALLLILPGLLIATRWSVNPAMIVIERAGPLESLDRSNSLVRGRTWSVLGAFVVVLLVSVTVAAPALVLCFTAESPWLIGVANAFTGVAFNLPGAAFSYAVYQMARSA